MAHMEKYSAGAVGHMMEHYDRGLGYQRAERENIDPELTANNYTVFHDAQGHATVVAWERRADGTWDTHAPGAEVIRAARERVNAEAEAAGKRKVRKDAVLMCDWVITAPKDLPRRDRELFFRTAHEYMVSAFGTENVLPGRVHVDEPGAEDHMHGPVIPLLDGRFNAKKMMSRGQLAAFHKGLQEAEDKALGYHVSVLLPEEEKGRKQLSHLQHKEFEAATAELQAVADRLEGVRRAEAEAVESGQLSRAAGRAIARECEGLCRELGEVGEREQAAQQRNQELRTRRDEVRERAGELENRLRSTKRDARLLRGRAERARDRLELARQALEQRVREWIARLMERTSHLTHWGAPQMVADIAAEMGYEYVTTETWEQHQRGQEARQAPEPARDLGWER